MRGCSMSSTSKRWGRKKMAALRIDAKNLHYTPLNQQIRKAVCDGVKEIVIDNVLGQRFIADGLRGDDDLGWSRRGTARELGEEALHDARVADTGQGCRELEPREECRRFIDLRLGSGSKLTGQPFTAAR